MERAIDLRGDYSPSVFIEMEEKVRSPRVVVRPIASAAFLENSDPGQTPGWKCPEVSTAFPLGTPLQK